MNTKRSFSGMMVILEAFVLTLGLVLSPRCAYAQSAAVTESAESVLYRVFRDDSRGRAPVLKSLVTHGEIEAFGFSGKFTRRFLAPDKWDVTLDFDAADFVQGYDGRDGWTIDQNGSLLEMSGHELEAMVTEAYLSGQLFLLEDDRAGVREYLGPLTYAGRGCHEFRFFPPGGSQLEVIIDSLNGALFLSRTELDDIREVTTYSDFRDVDGYAIPYRIQTMASVKQFNMNVRVNQCLVNIDLDPLSFTRAKSVHDDALFPFETDSVVVPLETSGGLLFVSVRVNGSRPLRFLLDSGAGANVITPATAESLGLTAAGKVPVKGIAGYESAAFVQLNSLAIGGVELVDQTVGAIALPPEITSGAGEISGVLGYDFFSRLTVTIDFSASHMIMYRPGFFDERVNNNLLTGFYELPLTFSSRIPHVDANMSGAPGRFVVDLGSNLGIIVHQSFAAAAGLDSLASTQNDGGGFSATGMGGAIGLTKLALPRFSLGPLSMREVSAMILGEGQGMSATRKIAGNLGTLFWKDFRLTLDYSSRRVFLFPVR